MGDQESINRKVDADYPLEWEKYFQAGGEPPEGWMRSPGDLGRAHEDRVWMYEHMDKPVLDIGCGTCIDAPGFGDGYVGLDITPSLLRVARFVYGVQNLILADGRSLPIRDNAFKSTYARDLLMHYLLEDALRFIEELCRTGKTSYVVWSRKYMPTDEEVISRNFLGFWWFTPDAEDLEERFWIGPPKGNTSVTEVNVK